MGFQIYDTFCTIYSDKSLEFNIKIIPYVIIGYEPFNLHGKMPFMPPLGYHRFSMAPRELHPTLCAPQLGGSGTLVLCLARQMIPLAASQSQQMPRWQVRQLPLHLL